MGHFKELNIVELQQNEEQEKEIQRLQPYLIGIEHVEPNDELDNIIVLSERLAQKQSHLSLVLAN